MERSTNGIITILWVAHLVYSSPVTLPPLGWLIPSITIISEDYYKSPKVAATPTLAYAKPVTRRAPFLPRLSPDSANIFSRKAISGWNLPTNTSHGHQKKKKKKPLKYGKSLVQCARVKHCLAGEVKVGKEWPHILDSEWVRIPSCQTDYRNCSCHPIHPRKGYTTPTPTQSR